MFAQPHPAGLVPGPSNLPPFRFSLDPLTAAGPAALAPDDHLEIGRVILVRAALRWRNVFNEVTIREADDLFACASRDGGYYDAVPKGAALVGVVLEFHFRDEPEPVTVELRPPRGLILPETPHRSGILSFLELRGFAKPCTEPG